MRFRFTITSGSASKHGLATLTMTSDVSFFNATVRGLERQKLAEACKRHGLKNTGGSVKLFNVRSLQYQYCVCPGVRVWSGA